MNMEERNGAVFGTFALILSDIALLEAAFVVFGSSEGSKTLSIGFLPWLALAVAELSLYRRFLRRERTLLVAVGFLTASYLVTAAVLFAFFVRLPGIVATIIAFLFWAVPQYHIYMSSEKPPTLEKLTTRFEGVIVALLLMLIFLVGTDRQLALLLPCAASAALCLASLVIMRTSRGTRSQGRRLRGVAVIVAFILMICVAVTVFLLFASASFADLIAAGVTALFDGIKFVFNLIARFLAWLSALIPVGEHGGGPLEGTVQAPDGPGEPDMVFDFGPTIVIVIVSAVVAIALVCLIIAVLHFRRKKIGGKRILVTSTVKQRRTRSRRSGRFINALRFFRNSILYRNTPQGVFVRLERWGRLRRCGRKRGETPRSYLLRLTENNPEHKTALHSLADALDSCWYGDKKHSQLPRRTLAKLRRSFSIAYFNPR